MLRVAIMAGAVITCVAACLGLALLAVVVLVFAGDLRSSEVDDQLAPVVAAAFLLTGLASSVLGAGGLLTESRLQRFWAVILAWIGSLLLAAFAQFEPGGIAVWPPSPISIALVWFVVWALLATPLLGKRLFSSRGDQNPASGNAKPENFLRFLGNAANEPRVPGDERL